MTPTTQDLKQIKRLVEGVALSRSTVIRGRVIWAWKRLSMAQRKRVESETRCEVLDANHLDRVLEARTLAGPVKRKKRTNFSEAQPKA